MYVYMPTYNGIIYMQIDIYACYVNIKPNDIIY